MECLDHVPHVLIQFHHRLVVALQVLQPSPHVRQDIMCLLQVCFEPFTLQLLDVVLQDLAACHVEETNTSSEGSWEQQGTLRGSRDDVFHVDSEETSHEIKAPEPEEHGQLPRVNAHFGPLHVVQLGTAATLSDVNHADSPKCGTNVGDGASHVRGADNGTKVGSAHGILQAACCRHQANREQPAWNEGGCHQQAGVQYQSQAIEGLAHEVHLILVDQETAGICTTQEGENQQACFLQAS
mmetsp:Transcript_23630/g.49019  ORF Transcript_23630/g.49019 Transcript_23630/m.49019 type:complete len:240 (-) Transcript_23630:337-1056(-)